MVRSLTIPAAEIMIADVIVGRHGAHVVEDIAAYGNSVTVTYSDGSIVTYLLTATVTALTYPHTPQA